MSGDGPIDGAVPPEASLWDAAMGAALHEAQEAAALGEVPVGAVVLFEGQIIARAGNSRERAHDPLGHAEVLVLRAAAHALGRWRLTGCTLVVTLEPCAMCAGAIVHSRIDRVVFGTRDPRAGAVGSILDLVRHPALNHRAQVESGVRQLACAQVLTAFFAARRKARLEARATESLPDPTHRP